MNKNAIIAILGGVIVFLVVLLVVMRVKGGSDEPPPPPPPGPGAEISDTTGGKLDKSKPVTAEDVDLLPAKRRVKNVFEVSGQGYYSKWGKGVKAAFRQQGVFVFESEIIERKKFGNGRFKVVEDKTFVEARETLEIGDTDYFFALDTLPIDKVASTLETAAKVAGLLAPKLVKAHPVAAAKVAVGAAGAGGGAAALRWAKAKFDGKDLSSLGLDFTDEAKAEVEEHIGGAKEIESIVRKVEGRRYRITYIQDGTGMPMNITAKRILDDGSLAPVETEEEIWVLSRSNAFIDAAFLENRTQTPLPGDRWKADAGAVARILGVEEGYCKGTLTCCRTDDAVDGGVWAFDINPEVLDVTDGSGRDLGKIHFGGGEAHVFADGRTLKDATMKGKGKLFRVNKYSLLFLPFNEKFIGECHFAGSMTTEKL